MHEFSIFFVRGCSMAGAPTELGGFMVLWFYVREHLKCTSTSSGSGLKRLRRQDDSF